MRESIAMSTTQCFEVERMNRAIEATADPAQLQTLALRPGGFLRSRMTAELLGVDLIGR
tara:strand:- start:130 stop:306 length:177 start_codon:yes stop_codon:yes gene_type:complete